MVNGVPDEEHGDGTSDAGEAGSIPGLPDDESPLFARTIECVLQRPYRKRITIGQLTTMPVEPNWPPPGRVMCPCWTIDRSWNSSISRLR